MVWFNQKQRPADGTSPRGAPAPGGPGMPPAGAPSGMPPRRTWLTFALVLLVNYMLVRFLFPGPMDPLTIPYTAFKEEVARGNVASIYAQGGSSEGRFIAPVTWPPPDASAQSGREEPRSRSDQLNQSPPRSSETFNTTLPIFVGPDLESFLIDHDVEISAVPIQSGSPLVTLLFGFGPAILIIAFYVWLFRRARQGAGGLGGLGGMMGIGKSKARRYDQEEGRVTFEDVAGIDEAENELVEIVDFLRDPAKYQRLGGRRRRACCWSAPRAPARRCSPARWPGRPGCRSSR